jgi:hypothetical protein
MRVMKDHTICYNRADSFENEEDLKCCICEKPLDLTASCVSSDSNDSIYLCFQSLKQNIFIYGKYSGGKYGAPGFSKYFSRNECEEKACEIEIKNFLDKTGDEEYSRLITCSRGTMKALILGKNLIQARKYDLFSGLLPDHFVVPDGRKKYFCHHHAAEKNFTCQCGEELLQIGSEKHRELIGMEDQKFANTFLPKILKLK